VSRCVRLVGDRAVRAPGFRERHGVAVRDTLMAACQVAGIGAAGLLLPCPLIDLAFETDILSIMRQAMLAAFACALMVAVWTDQQE
jgi:hypothetical protein